MELGQMKKEELYIVIKSVKEFVFTVVMLNVWSTYIFLPQENIALLHAKLLKRGKDRLTSYERNNYHKIVEKQLESG